MRIRNSIFLLVIFITPISAYCEEKLEWLKKMNTRYGVVSVKKDAENYGDELFVNKRKLPISDAIISIAKKWEIGDKDILLISTSGGGNACESFYNFLIVTKNQVVASEQFGNCGSPDISKIKDSILLRFSRQSRYAPAETVEYDNGKVYGKAGKLKMEATPL